VNFYPQTPPEPNKAQSASREVPCGNTRDNDGEDDGSGGPTPPPGLCMPIDDYVYILMAVGVMYGCYKLRDFESV